MIDIYIKKRLTYFTIDAAIRFDGGVLILKGESGSGKTTILDCIAGIQSPDEGVINLFGRELFSSCKKINIATQERDIGYVFQNYALFPHMTVKQNILYGIKSKGIQDSSHMEKILNAFKLEHISDRTPSQISGGERQRTALARAMAIKPRLLLMDEPFSAMDSETKETVYKEFIEFKRNWDTAVILVTHNEEEAKILGDKVVQIKDGRVIS